jgi:rhodanese-related sulfurtransferase
MMKRWILITIALFLIGVTSCANNKDINISGTLKEGLRWITLDPVDGKSFDLQVYRGDYVKFALKNNKSALLEIPEMDVAVSLPMTDPDKPYIKFKQPGTFSFTVAGSKGTIVVHEYVRSNYTAVTSKEAIDVIKERDPLILDVRTPGEFKRGHLKDALLIPVQELQRRIKELDEYKDKPILIYCATGNRSTVAAKILLDKGFREIYNLRYGISGWARDGYEIDQ